MRTGRPARQAGLPHTEVFQGHCCRPPHPRPTQSPPPSNGKIMSWFIGFSTIYFPLNTDREGQGAPGQGMVGDRVHHLLQAE